MSSSLPDATHLLTQASRGQASAAADLMPLVYQELRQLAERYLGREPHGHTLQPTALVHEAFLRLMDAPRLEPNGQTHFFAIAANVMRRVLVEHARARRAAKRGGGHLQLTLDSELAILPAPDMDLLALHEALERLAELDPRQARVVELRFFGGLSMEDVAAELGMSKRTVEDDWALARAWLRRELRSG